MQKINRMYFLVLLFVMELSLYSLAIEPKEQAYEEYINVCAYEAKLKKYCDCVFDQINLVLTHEELYILTNSDKIENSKAFDAVATEAGNSCINQLPADF